MDEEFFPGFADKLGHVHNMWLTGFAGDWFALDRLMFVRLVMTVVMAVFFILGVRNPKLRPHGLQTLVEMFLDFVKVQICEEILGKKETKRFLPLITTIFFLVLFENLPSIIPGLNVSPNARIGMPLFLAIVGYVVFIYAGVKRYGFFKYFKCSLVVPNLPTWVYFLAVPIEFVSTFILRPFTLTIRLMANMLSGHLILALLFTATNFFVWQLNGWTALGGLTLLAGVVFMMFELMVIGLQAYIFALLSTVYIELSLHADEH